MFSSLKLFFTMAQRLSPTKYISKLCLGAMAETHACDMLSEEKGSQSNLLTRPLTSCTVQLGKQDKSSTRVEAS